MAIWFMRLSAVICLAAIVGVLSLFGYDWYRERLNDANIAAAQERVEALGGSLSRDGEDNDYIILLHNSAVNDAQIAELVVLLRPLAAGSSPTPEVPQRFAFNLAGTEVGDPAMRSIATLPVAWLNLNNTKITDDGLLQLRDQRRLHIVTVAGTRVTRPGIQAMRDSLPHVWIPNHDRRLAQP
jgi:hypothetical protein